MDRRFRGVPVDKLEGAWGCGLASFRQTDESRRGGWLILSKHGGFVRAVVVGLIVWPNHGGICNKLGTYRRIGLIEQTHFRPWRIFEVFYQPLNIRLI